MAIIQSEQQKEKQIFKNESNLRDLWDNIKHINFRIIGVPEGEKRKKRIKNVFDEIMAENFPILKKEADIYVQEAQRVPNKMKPNRSIPKHAIIKMAKVKDRILKAAREKQRFIHKGIPIRLSADFSAETLQVRGQWHDIPKVLKGKKLQPRILYPARLSLRNEEEIKKKYFSDKQKLEVFISTKSILKEVLKGLLQVERKLRIHGKGKISLGQANIQ